MYATHVRLAEISVGDLTRLLRRMPWRWLITEKPGHSYFFFSLFRGTFYNGFRFNPFIPLARADCASVPASGRERVSRVRFSLVCVCVCVRVYTSVCTYMHVYLSSLSRFLHAPAWIIGERRTFHVEIRTRRLLNNSALLRERKAFARFRTCEKRDPTRRRELRGFDLRFRGSCTVDLASLSFAFAFHAMRIRALQHTYIELDFETLYKNYNFYIIVRENYHSISYNESLKKKNDKRNFSYIYRHQFATRFV